MNKPNRKEIEDYLITVTLDLMDLTDEMDLTELGEGIVSTAWKTEYRFPNKRDLNFLTDDLVLNAAWDLEEALDWLELDM